MRSDTSGSETRALDAAGHGANPVETAVAIPQSQASENVRLVIWDLDDTFWSGTLEEGGISPIAANIAIVQALSARGIINSIASKNHEDRARAELEKLGVWDLFVLPRIAFVPKGEMVRAVIDICQLRAASVLFVDDNPINLNEVIHYNPGIQTALPDLLPNLLDDPRFRGAPDPKLTRLKRYKILETREADRSKHASDNTEFLRASEIRISIHHDIWPEFPRIHELINRSNQLNFTKKRVNPDLKTAEGDMRKTIDTIYNCQAAYIKVADKYGYYGVCGFYMIINHQVEHFLFSCRALNMGLEQFVYQRLHRVHVPMVGDVVSDPARRVMVDWINVVDDAEVGLPERAASAGDDRVILLRGGCEMQQASHYLRERFVVEEEVAYGFGAWAMYQGLTDYAVLKDAYHSEQWPGLFERPWFDPKMMDSAIYSGSADIYIFSFGNEPYVSRYRHKPSGLIMPMALFGKTDVDLTTLSYDVVKDLKYFDMTEGQWAEMRESFELTPGFDSENFISNVSGVLDLLLGKRVVLVLGNTRHGEHHGVNELNAMVNDAVERAAAGYGASIVRMDDVIETSDDVMGMNHFRREVYLRLVRSIMHVLDSPAPRPALQLQPKSRRWQTAPKRNLLPDPENMQSQSWRTFGPEVVEATPVYPLFAGHVIMSHRLVKSTGDGSPLVHGCFINEGIVGGETYVISVWVWIPKRFRGTNVSVCAAGFASPGLVPPSLRRRDCWQRCWVRAKVPESVTVLLPTLCISGEKGDEIFSTAWKVEHGASPTDFAPRDKAAQPELVA